MAIKNLTEIETKLGMKEGQFKEFMESKDEVTVEIDKLEIIPKSDYEQRIANIEKEKIAQGKTIGAEETRKEFKDAFAVETAVSYKKIPIADFANAVKEKLIKDAGITPDEKTKQWEIDKQALIDRAKKAEEKVSGLETEYKRKEKTSKIQNTIISALPKELILPTEEAAELTIKRARKAGISFDIDDETGTVIFKRGDEIIKDANRNFEKPEVVLKDFYSPFAKPLTGGDPAKDNPGSGGGKKTTMDAFLKEMQDAGKNISEINIEMAKRLKENPKYFS